MCHSDTLFCICAQLYVCLIDCSCSWGTEGASIFSIEDGKRLAQTPVKLPTPFELNRMRKVAEAAVDKRVVNGIRLMPEYTPARAMLWVRT